MRASAVLELLAQVELLRGDLDAAEAALREGYAILDSTGEQGYLVGVAPALGSILCSLGRHDEAEPLARLSEQHAVPEDVLAQVLWRGVWRGCWPAAESTRPPRRWPARRPRWPRGPSA